MLDFYKRSIGAAIEQYERQFTRENPPSIARAMDIRNLHDQLSDAKIRELEVLMRQVQQWLDSLKTGWWIFRTGRSKLKSLVSKANKSFNPAARHMLESMQELQFEIAELPTNAANESLRRSLERAQTEIRLLGAKVKKLMTENAQLSMRTLPTIEEAASQCAAQEATSKMPRFLFRR